MAESDQNTDNNNNVVECRLVLGFYSPSYQSLYSYVGIALQSSFGLTEDVLQIGKIHADKECDMTYIHFKIAGSDYMNTWKLVNKLRKGVSDPTSPLHTLPRMKNVFNRCRLEIRESTGDGQKTLRYVEKGPNDPLISTSFPLDRLSMSPPSALANRSLPHPKVAMPPHAGTDPFAVVLVDPMNQSEIEIPSGRYVKVELPASPKKVHPKTDIEALLHSSFDLNAIDAALSKPRPVIPESLMKLMHELSIH